MSILLRLLIIKNLDNEMSKDKDIDKLVALISISFKKINKPTNNNLKTSSNTSRANKDNTPRINRGTRYDNQRVVNVVGARENAGIDNDIYSTVDACPNDNSPSINRSVRYENQRIGNVAGARETVGSIVVQKSRIQCYNYKEFGHVAKECQKPKRAKDAAYHREKMIAHPEQSKSVHDTYPIEQDAQIVIIDSLDINYDKEEIDQNDDDNDLAKEQLARHNSKEYASKMELDCAKKEAQIKLYKTREDKELDKVIELEQKVKDLKAQLQDKGIVIRVIPTTSVSRPQLKSNPMGDRVMHNNLQGKKQEVEDQRKNVKLPKNKMSVTACHDSLNAKTLNVKSVSAMCDKCVLIDKHAMCVLNSVAKPLKETVSSESNKKPRNFTRKLYERVSKTCSWWYPKFTPSGYKWKPKSGKENVNLNLVEIVLFIVDSGCSKHMTGNLKLLINFVEKFLGTVKFGNDQIAPILGYEDLVQGAVMIKRVYYVEGLNHNLFSVGQFCDADLEVAFRKLTCFIRDLKGNDLLTGSRGMDLYSITLQDTNCPNPIYLMAKASSSQAWLWHRRLSHLNFDSINLLSKNDIMVGLPKLKFVKDHICSSCELGKAKRKSFHTKLTPSSKRRLQLLHMDLCGPMRVASLSKEDFKLKLECAVKVPLFFWAEAIATTCFTQNRSLVIPRHEKTPYHIINNQKPSVKFFHIFGSICYIVRDGENLNKMKEKGDECIFVGYSTQSRAYRVFNKRTRVIMESIHVNFDELPHMASDQISSDPAHECQRMALEQDSLSPTIQHQANVPQADKTVIMSNELDLLFSPMFDELLNRSSKVVSKSSAVSSANAPNQRQHHTTPLNNHTTPAPTCQVPSLAPTISSSESISQAETYAENDQVADDEFINIFCIPVQDQGETSSRHVDLSNMHTFYQRYPSEHRWTKDHPLEQVIRNPSQSVITRRQLESDAEMCMFVLIVS
nr:integrase, catalytic region, zinc finger, CCHC-type, peptidase aspartic, catalytic [Tanacetum cinerariifolium]